MSERLRSLRRVVAAHQALTDRAAWKLAAAERAKAEATAARDALDAFVAEDRPTGAFALLAGRTAARLAAREAEVEAQRQAVAAAKLALETRLKLAGKAAETVAAAERDRAERKHLEQMVEALMAAAPRPEAG